MLRNPPSLSVSSFLEHLYVFVLLMNGTKVSGGPAVVGGLWERKSVAMLKWTLLSGQLAWGWQWENRRQWEWWRLDPTTSSLLSLAFFQPLLNPSSMIDDPSSHLCQKLLPPLKPPKLHACCLHLCTCTHFFKPCHKHTHIWTNTLTIMPTFTSR